MITMIIIISPFLRQGCWITGITAAPNLIAYRPKHATVLTQKLSEGAGHQSGSSVQSYAGMDPRAHYYHWQELPQASFCRDKNVFVATKHIFCRDKSMLGATNVLSWENYVCRLNIFVAAKLLSRLRFVVTNTCLSLQKFYRDKHTFVATIDAFCSDKHVFVATKVSLSRQNLWSNICLASEKFCRDQYTFVVTKDVFCRDKNDNCGSSRQWWTTRLPLDPNVHRVEPGFPSLLILIQQSFWWWRCNNSYIISLFRHLHTPSPAFPPPPPFSPSLIIIMYIYHALINALSAHMIHNNLNMIFYIWCSVIILMVSVDVMHHVYFLSNTQKQTVVRWFLDLNVPSTAQRSAEDCEQFISSWIDLSLFFLVAHFPLREFL